MTHRFLAAMTVAALTGCASHADVASDPPDADVDAGRATSAATSEATDAASPFPTEPPKETPPPRCAPRPTDDACRPGGFVCDAVGGDGCCGSCIDGMCCSARGQGCTNTLFDTCCGGLRCSSRCICE
jgi:hypothetical protein